MLPMIICQKPTSAQQEYDSIERILQQKYHYLELLAEVNNDNISGLKKINDESLHSFITFYTFILFFFFALQIYHEIKNDW